MPPSNDGKMDGGKIYVWSIYHTPFAVRDGLGISHFWPLPADAIFVFSASLCHRVEPMGQPSKIFPKTQKNRLFRRFFRKSWSE